MKRIYLLSLALMNFGVLMSMQQPILSIKKAKKNTAGEEKLFYAASNGKLNKVIELIELGVDPNSQNTSSKKTALYSAVQNGHADIVEYLIAHGANPLIPDSGGNTAIDVAKKSKTSSRERIYKALDVAFPVETNTNKVAAAATSSTAQTTSNKPVASASSTTQSVTRSKLRKATDVGLYVAAGSGDLNEVMELIELGVDPNSQKASNKKTALSLAIQNGHTDVVRYLLANGADPSIPDINGDTALDVARKSTNRVKSKIIALLETNNHPLLKATKDNDFDEIKLLIKANVGINETALKEALLIATSAGYWNIVAALIQAGADTKEVMSIAIKAGFWSTVANLIQAGADAQGIGLQKHVEKGHYEVVKALLDRGRDISNIPLIKGCITIAIEAGYWDIVAALIESVPDEEERLKLIARALHRGENKNMKDSRGLALFIELVTDEDERLRFIKYALDQDADVNMKDDAGFTLLEKAVIRGDYKMTELLLRHDADVNTIDSAGFTPLNDAVTRGNYEITKLLLDYGADVNAQDPGDRSALLWVGRMTEGSPKKDFPQISVQKAVELVELLLSRGADPSLRDKFGKTALRWAETIPSQKPLADVLRKASPTHATIQTTAVDPQQLPLWLNASRGNLQMVNWHLSHEGNPNEASPGGLTALALAARNGHQQVVSRLIEAGADLNKKNRGNDTALTLAVREQQIPTIQQLINAGAIIGQEELSIAKKLGNKKLIEILESGLEKTKPSNEAMSSSSATSSNL